MPKLTIKEWADEILATILFTVVIIGLPFGLTFLFEVTQ